MPRRRFRLTGLWMLLGMGLTCLIGAPAMAQGTAPEPPAAATAVPPHLTVEDIKAKRSEIEANDTLDEATKATLGDLYRRATEALQAASQAQARAQSYRDAITEAPKRIQALRAELAKPREGEAPAPVAPSEDVATAALEQRLLQAQADLAAAKKALADLEKAISTLEQRPAAARNELTEAQGLLKTIVDESARPRPEGESPDMREAQKALLAARRMRREAEIDMLQQEQLSAEIRAEQLRLERERAVRQVSQAELAERQAQAQLNERRQTEAAETKAQAEQTRREAATKHPALSATATRNAELTQELQQVADDTERLTNEKARISERATQIRQDFENAKRRVALAGVTQTLGRYLRDQRSRLEDRRTHSRNAEVRERKVGDISLRQLQIAEQLQELERPEAAAYAVYIKHADGTLLGAEREAIESEIRDLLVQRRLILEKLSTAYGNELRVLSDLDFEEQQRADAGLAYATFLDERLLWVPSTQVANLETFRTLPEAVNWLLSPRTWSETAQALWSEARQAWWWAALALVLPGLLLGLRKYMRERLDALAASIGRVQTDRFAHTAEALGLTVLIAIGWPVLLGIVGWRLQDASYYAEQAGAIGTGALYTALFLIATFSLYALCQPKGVAASHFKWSPLNLGLLRRHLAWWIPLAAVTIFVTSTLDWQGDPERNASLGRLAFIVQAGALMALAYYLLHPARGLPARLLLRHPQGWVARLRFLWFGAALALPLALAVLAATGFYYTALQIEDRLVATAGVVFGAIIVYHLMLRWLYVTRRQLEYRRVRERRQAEAAAQAATPEATTDSGIALTVDAAEVDIASLNQQTHHLVKVVVTFLVVLGLWWVWVDVLPALSVLGEVELWRYSGELNGEPATIPVTLESVILLVFLAIVVTVAAKNLPAVLEIAVLQRLPLDNGLRYAIRTITQYTIVGVGLVTILDTLGVGWGKLQWLVAALGVGLGFGLQEIFANFVSGLILLFERPIRIGDAVTVGDTTGTVTRIRIRATTLLDWDNKEIIVPNKVFITERLVNWTLTDAITRVVIPIGVAYGSDVEKTQRLVTEVVGRNPLVLNEPPMQMLFLGLGESSLDFELRIYVRVLADRLVVTDQLLKAIYATLNQNGIEIPFPQRDLHIKGLEKLGAALHGAAAAVPEAPQLEAADPAAEEPRVTRLPSRQSQGRPAVHGDPD